MSNGATDPRVDSLVTIIRGLLVTKSLDEACALLIQSNQPTPLVREARLRIERQIQQVRILRDPPTIQDSALQSWYPGPAPDDRYWPRYCEYLLEKQWSEKDIKDLDSASTKIVSLLHHPGLGRFQTRGLVAGDVQSGKTANFTAVISKAADVGYRMFIVMSGVTNKLRAQTQQRLDSHLRDLNLEYWVTLTNTEDDFGRAAVTNINAFLTQYAQQKTLVVVKKHSGRLNKLLQWIRSANETVLANCPVLVIDDEADQASINTSQDPDERNKVNARILDILQTLPKAAYVGYTATPYANFFIDAGVPEDLYPRHFIVNLPASDAYFGYERIFGRERTRFDEDDEDIDGYDMIRRVPDEEAKLLRPSGPARIDVAAVPSLHSAIFYFWLATSARLARGDVHGHSSMLIHTSQRVSEHGRIKEAVVICRDRLLSELNSRRRSDIVADLRTLWEDENNKVPPEIWGRKPIPFDQVFRFFPGVVERTRIITENYKTHPEDRLVYGDEPGIFVVIGGDVLSRGLTLEGLVTSFFIRSASAYDTLMQMGRWFGYRFGYEDLPRIWTTDDLRSQFFELGGIDREMRQLITKVYCGQITPAEFAPLIRTHPDLMITSRMKMGSAVPVYLSYGDKHIQTILYSHQDRDWLLSNIEAARELVKGSTGCGCSVGRGAQGHWIIRDVPSTLILKFFRKYRFHSDSWNLRSDALIDYVEGENAVGSLKRWNMVIAGLGENRHGVVDLALPERINLIKRSRIDAPQIPYANIKSLISLDDCVADLSNRLGAPADWSDLVRIRNEMLPETGLLILYPIDKVSNPSKSRPSQEMRIALGAIEHVIGVGLVFPASKAGASGRRYMTQDLSAQAREFPEYEEDDV